MIIIITTMKIIMVKTDGEAVGFDVCLFCNRWVFVCFALVCFK